MRDRASLGFFAFREQPHLPAHHVPPQIERMGGGHEVVGPIVERESKKLRVRQEPKRLRVFSHWRGNLREHAESGYRCPPYTEHSFTVGGGDGSKPAWSRAYASATGDATVVVFEREDGTDTGPILVRSLARVAVGDDSLRERRGHRGVARHRRAGEGTADGPLMVAIVTRLAVLDFWRFAAALVAAALFLSTFLCELC